MPRIKLKPNSAEFEDETVTYTVPRRCDMPGCAAGGEHRAPKDRSLSDHYWFCLSHVQEYNKAWDFFSGMSQQDIETHIVNSMLGDRPTRRYDPLAADEDKIYRKAWQTYNYTEREPEQPKASASTAGMDRNSPEFQALAIMGLVPPADMKAIKVRYKELVKKHHPDINRNDPTAGELLKKINMAYTILKLAFEKFEKLPERPDA